jgi:hypothetical protein
MAATRNQAAASREGVTLKTLFSPQSLDFSGEYEQIPPRMRDAILRYACHGAELGSFLQAVIRNDLFGAFGSADAENKPLIGLYVSWFYNRCPECLVGAENYRKQTSILG